MKRRSRGVALAQLSVKGGARWSDLDASFPEASQKDSLFSFPQSHIQRQTKADSVLSVGESRYTGESALYLFIQMLRYHGNRAPLLICRCIFHTDTLGGALLRSVDESDAGEGRARVSMRPSDGTCSFSTTSKQKQAAKTKKII